MFQQNCSAYLSTFRHTRFVSFMVTPTKSLSLAKYQHKHRQRKRDVSLSQIFSGCNLPLYLVKHIDLVCVHPTKPVPNLIKLMFANITVLLKEDIRIFRLLHGLQIWVLLGLFIARISGPYGLRSQESSLRSHLSLYQHHHSRHRLQQKMFVPPSKVKMFVPPPSMWKCLSPPLCVWKCLSPPSLLCVRNVCLPPSPVCKKCLSPGGQTNVCPPGTNKTWHTDRQTDWRTDRLTKRFIYID